jgi:hypothetical protein
VRIDHHFRRIAVTSVPYPFRSQMAKVQLRPCLKLINVPSVKGYKGLRNFGEP